MMEYLAHSAKGDIPRQSYTEHVENVRRLAVQYARLASSYFSGDCHELIDLSEICAAYHDLGKLEKENQIVLHENFTHAALPINHVDAGAAVLKSLLPENYLPSMIVYSHHRGLPNFPDERIRENNCFRDINPEIRNQTDRHISDLLCIHESVLNSHFRNDHPGNIQCDPGIFTRILLSCLADADHTDTAHHFGMYPDKSKEPLLRAEERLKKLDEYVSRLGNNTDERSRLRSEMYQNCRNSICSKNIAACDSPVGSGKTTAVMAHLLDQAKKRGSRRIFVVLPYTNIISQSVEVYRKALVLPGEDPEEVVAELHHRADFENEDTRILTALWRAPIIVTTAAAFFETIASNRPAALRRLHELPGSVIFVDEAHAALPVKLLSLAWKWIQTFADEWGCYWVLASGSLVEFWKINEITKQPRFIPHIIDNELRKRLKNYEVRRIEFPWIPKSISVNDLIARIVSAPGPRLVIMNTVQSAAVIAKDLFEFFIQKYGPNDQTLRVLHLSTALNADDRNSIIHQVKNQLENKNETDWVLVATSCVEAGVDFSFHSGFREISSLMSLLQASGRINRSGEYQDSCIWSFSMQEDRLLSENPVMKDSSYVLTRYFTQEKEINMDLCTQAIRDELNRLSMVSDFVGMLDKSERSLCFKDVAEKFVVIDSDTVPVIVDEEQKTRIKSGIYNWKDIQKKAVMVRRYWVNRLNLPKLADDIYEWNLSYSNFLGIMDGLLDYLENN